LSISEQACGGKEWHLCAWKQSNQMKLSICCMCNYDELFLFFLLFYQKHTYKRWRWNNVNVSITCVILASGNMHAYPSFLLRYRIGRNMSVHVEKRRMTMFPLEENSIIETAKTAVIRNSIAYCCVLYANKDTQLILSFFTIHIRR
jgi:hypothetical protein